jgi:hypothetical protein
MDFCGLLFLHVHVEKRKNFGGAEPAASTSTSVDTLILH